MTIEDEIRKLIMASMGRELPDDATPAEIRAAVLVAVDDLRAEIAYQGEQLTAELIAEAEEARE